MPTCNFITHRNAAKTPHKKKSLETQITATDRQLDNLVYELYGLTAEEVRIVEGEGNRAMSLSIGAESASTGPARYAAYLPFVLSGAVLNSSELPLEFQVGQFGLKFEKLQHGWAVSMSPFDSIETALEHLKKLRASLLWFCITKRIGVSYPKETEKVTLYDKPNPIEPGGNLAFAEGFGWKAIDGCYDASKAVIRLEEKRLLRIEFGQISAILGLNNLSVSQSLAEGLKLVLRRHSVESSKLNLAMELYAAASFELSANAKFITLVSALESLLHDTKIEPYSTKVLQDAFDLVRTVRDKHEKKSGEWAQLERLLSRMGGLKSESIKRRLQNFVKATLEKYDDPETVAKICAQVSDVYDARSTLLHDGDFEEQQVSGLLTFLGDFVPRLLEKLFRESVEEASSDAVAGVGTPTPDFHRPSL